MEKVARVRGSEARSWLCITHIAWVFQLTRPIFETLPPDKTFAQAFCLGHVQLHVFFSPFSRLVNFVI